MPDAITASFARTRIEGFTLFWVNRFESTGDRTVGERRNASAFRRATLSLWRRETAGASPLLSQPTSLRSVCDSWSALTPQIERDP